MKKIVAIVVCLTLGGCYEGYTLGRCNQDNAHHHTEHDLGGIAWCVPGAGGTTSTSSLWSD